MYLSIIKFNLSGFLNFLNIQEILCSTASCFFHKSILSRICSVLQHPVFSRNLFYPGTALLYSIPSFPEIYSFQDILCSAASCLFHKSSLCRICSALQHPVFSRKLFYTGLLCSAAPYLFQKSILSGICSALQHPVFSRNIFYPGSALLCSILFFPGIYSIQELLCSALQHPVFSRNLFYPGTALLCSILSFPKIYSIQELLCSTASCLFQESILSRKCSALQHPIFSKNLFYPGTPLLYSILSFPRIYSIQELLCSAASCLFQKSILSKICSVLQYLSKNLSIQELICSAASFLFQEFISSYCLTEKYVQYPVL